MLMYSQSGFIQSCNKRTPYSIRHRPRESYSKTTQLSVTFGSGYLAGILCAIVSQPADNLVSQMGKASNRGKTFGQMAAEQGAHQLFFNGLGPRILMIGTLTGLQWWIYDSFKTAFGLGTSGGRSAGTAEEKH